MSKGRCEFCGRIKFVESTSFVGEYCIECHKTLIEESQNAIKEIKRQK